MARVHWVGAGLSSVPGIRRLIERGRTVTVWNRTKAKADAAVAGLTGDCEAQTYTLDALRAAVKAGDLVVSMLPGDFHVTLADLCIEVGAHFVSSSYVSDEMRARDEAAKEKHLRLVNEVGLDPGIDHLMAFALMADYKASDAFSPDNEHLFRSYCGGLSKAPNDFRYKFSWSPLGVLKALKSPSKSLRDGAEFDVDRPWNAIASYEAPLPGGAEVFEVYPNRNSLPYVAEYGFGPDWNVQEFVRGTLRYGGWAEAWSDIFAEVETLDGPEGDRRLAEISNRLWTDYRFDDGEPDRVVLCVDLQVRRDGHDIWSKSYVMDAYGNERGSAMARLVSTHVSTAVEAVLDREIDAGVSTAPSRPDIVESWLATLGRSGEPLAVVDHLA